MPIKPLGDRIVTKAIESKSKAEKALEEMGLVAPDKIQKDKPTRFEVLAIGSGEKAEDLGLEVGDIVILNRFAGSEVDDEIEVDGKLKEVKVKIVLAGDVQGVVCD